jgi:hypothetical protein
MSKISFWEKQKSHVETAIYWVEKINNNELIPEQRLTECEF